jgi:ketosteroid isomerase-like protein
MQPDAEGLESDGWIDDLIAAFNDHDAVAVGRLMTADAVYICWSGDAWTTTSGRESIVQLIDDYDKELSSDFRLRKTFAVITDEGFAIEYHETGTHDRGQRPTGRSFSLRNVMVGELHDGEISRMTDYSDVTAFRAQTTLT